MSSKNQQEYAILPQRLNALFQEERAQGTSARSILLKLGMSETALAEWNRGKSKPTIGAITKLARYFNVSADYLLGLTDERRPLSSTEVGQPKTAVTEKGTSEIAVRYKHLFEDADFVKVAAVYDSVQIAAVKGLLVGYFLAAAKSSGVDTSIVGF